MILESDISAQLVHLAQLGAVIVVAVGAVLLLVRLSDRGRDRTGDLLPGYPPDRFPAQELVRSGPLQALATTQQRLASIYHQLPRESSLAIWLRNFLGELREIMDTAYRVRVITQVYGQPVELDGLVSEVQQIEQQIAEQVVQQLLWRDGTEAHELLDSRLSALRRSVRELAALG